VPEGLHDGLQPVVARGVQAAYRKRVEKQIAYPSNQRAARWRGSRLNSLNVPTL
jgi:hypothetical protein